jgi:hypothetical protein
MALEPMLPWLCIALLIAGWVLLLPNAILEAHRQRSLAIVLTSLIGLSLAAIYAMPSVSPANLFLAFLSAGLMAAPLLERARYLGLSLAIIAGSVAFIYAIAWLPTSLSPSVLLLVAAITATLVGMVGGMLMPLHPARHVEGKALWRLSPQAPMLLGWLALAAALALAMVSSGAVLEAASSKVFH